MTSQIIARLDASDRAIFARWTVAPPPPLVARLWTLVTHLGGSTATILAVLLPAFVSLFLTPDFAIRVRQASLAGALTLLISHLLVQVLKRTAGRPRPSPADARCRLPEKGLDLAFEAVKLARSRAKSRVILAVAGDGPYANECRSRAPFDTMFTGRLSGTALSAFYASADIFLFPSRTDTFGNVLLEAMASRLAVVAADSPPSRELLEWDSPGEIAGIVASPDAASVASELVRLADDPDVRRALAASGYARAATRTWDSAHAPLLADYATLAAGRR